MLQVEVVVVALVGTSAGAVEAVEAEIKLRGIYSMKRMIDVVILHARLYFFRVGWN